MGKSEEEEKEKIRRLEMKIAMLESRLQGGKKPYLGFKKFGLKPPPKPPSGGKKFRSTKLRQEIGPILRGNSSPDPYYQPKPGQMSLSNNRPTVHWTPKAPDQSKTVDTGFNKNRSRKEQVSDGVQKFNPNKEMEIFQDEPVIENLAESLGWENEFNTDEWNPASTVDNEIGDIPENNFDDPDLWGTEVEAIPFADEFAPDLFDDDPFLSSETSLPHENPLTDDFSMEPEPLGEGVHDIGEFAPLEPIPELQPLPELSPLGELPGFDVMNSEMVSQDFGDPFQIGFDDYWDDPFGDDNPNGT